MYDDVTVLEEVDFEKQQEELYELAMSIANKNSDGKEHNPMSIKRKRGKRKGEVATESLSETVIELSSEVGDVRGNGLSANFLNHFGL